MDNGPGRLGTGLLDCQEWGGSANGVGEVADMRRELRVLVKCSKRKEQSLHALWDRPGSFAGQGAWLRGDVGKELGSGRGAALRMC